MGKKLEFNQINCNVDDFLKFWIFLSKYMIYRSNSSHCSIECFSNKHLEDSDGGVAVGGGVGGAGGGGGVGGGAIGGGWGGGGGGVCGRVFVVA